MLTPEQEEILFFERLEKSGEASVRADIDTNRFSGRKHQAIKWLNLKDMERQQEADALRAREIAATESAADSAKKSAKWAGWAIVISIAALLITALPYIAK